MFRLLVVVLVVHRVQDGVGVLRELRERERERERNRNGGGERKRENVVVSMEPAKRNKEPGVLNDISHTRGSIAITLVVMTVVVLMAVIVIDVNPR